MAKNRVKQKSKKNNKKIKINSAHAGLCAIAPVIKDKKVFEIIHQKVEIPQKKIDYSPTDKLVFAVLGIMSGCSVVFDINRKFRVDRILLRAFGYQKCADQSVIQDTLNAAEEQNVIQLEDALKEMWDEFNWHASGKESRVFHQRIFLWRKEYPWSPVGSNSVFKDAGDSSRNSLPGEHDVMQDFQGYG